MEGMGGQCKSGEGSEGEGAGSIGVGGWRCGELGGKAEAEGVEEERLPYPGGSPTVSLKGRLNEAPFTESPLMAPLEGH